VVYQAIERLDAMNQLMSEEEVPDGHRPS
jgi:hypothetical protein